METPKENIVTESTLPILTSYKKSDFSSLSSASSYNLKMPMPSETHCSSFLVPLDFKKSNNGKVECRIFPPVGASNVFNAFLSIVNENSILKEIVKNQWLTIKYNKEYSAYLLGLYSEEEFYELAEKFAVEPKMDIDDQYFYSWMKIIFNTLNEKLSSSDISILTNIDCSLIEAKMIEANSLEIFP